MARWGRQTVRLIGSTGLEVGGGSCAYLRRSGVSDPHGPHIHGRNVIEGGMKRSRVSWVPLRWRLGDAEDGIQTDQTLGRHVDDGLNLRLSDATASKNHSCDVKLAAVNPTQLVLVLGVVCDLE